LDEDEKSIHTLSECWFEFQLLHKIKVDNSLLTKQNS
jgi:hypothetical protein